jgi:hypothetical protein
MSNISVTAHEENPTWRELAACRGLHPDLFHPERGTDTRTPKQVCADCPVTAECLAFALVNFEKHGIWGGMSERERRTLRRNLTRTGVLQPPPRGIDHGTVAGYHAHRRAHQVPCDECKTAYAVYRAHDGRPSRAKTA